MLKGSSAVQDLTSGIKDVARRARSEEDLRIGVEKLLDPALKRLGILSEAQYERSILRGSPDALYGHLVLEYERPGKLQTKPGLKETTRQLVRYLQDFATRAGGRKEEALCKMVGVSLDGCQILFLRYKPHKFRYEFPGFGILRRPQLTLFPEPLLDRTLKGKFQQIGPVEVTPESIEVFLTYLRALRRRELSSDRLVEVFGPKGEVASLAVNAFYQNLLKHQSRVRTQTFFKEWERIFGIVYGQDLAKAEKDAFELAKLYGVEGELKLKPLLFAVHTYYALLMKLLASELLSLQTGSFISSFVAELPAISAGELKARMAELEGGGYFKELGIINFLEGDFFGWYLDEWDEGISAVIRRIAQELSEFEPATSTLEPEVTRDLLKKLYQNLVPKRLRHDLGEYYTPDWLAERIFGQILYEGNPKVRILDPGCGSGTFPVLAIKRVREYARENLLEPKEVASQITENIVGFDLNPLAVISARVNYLLALGDLIRYKRPIELPIYMCDSILTPSESSDLFGKDYSLPTSVGEFLIPYEVIERGKLKDLTALLEECVKSEYKTAEFIELAANRLGIESLDTQRSLKKLYRKVLGLEQEGKNGIWVRILKNAFAPIFVGKFDYVVGNPPWVRWGYLSGEYRSATQKLWQNYGLFSLKGYEARLGAGEKDFSMLFAYACSDYYLKNRGKLGFVITQTVFKAKGAGEGFRRFQLGDKEPLKVIHVDDLVELQPFEDAANRTSVLVMQKGLPTEYPVHYMLWQRKGGRISPELTLDEILEKTRRLHLIATPVDKKKPTSAWSTVQPKTAAALEKIRGKADYKAYRGAETDPYGVYQLRILSKLPDGNIMIENLYDAGKTKINRIQAAIEPEFICPFLRGKDINRWAANPKVCALMVQDPEKRIGYEERWMKVKYPKTFAYLKKFESILRNRGSRVFRELSQRGAFYSMFGIGTQTFIPWKVIWQRMGKELNAVTVSKHKIKEIGDKVVIPAGTTSFIPCKTSGEAHYICALLNSSPSRFAIQSFSAAGRGFGAPSILNHLKIPKYDPANFLHCKLSDLSQQAHKLAKEVGDLSQIETQIDLAAAKLWNLTTRELEEIKRSLKELG